MSRARDGVAVVTGGTAGVGRAVVRRLAADGYDIGVLARGRAGLAGAAADVRALGRRAVAIPTDVADPAAVERAARRVEEELGEIEVWVNAAFAGFLAPLSEVTPEQFHRVTHVTYHGQVHGTMAALRRMRPRDRGVVINVGSAMTSRGIPLQSAYCGAKHAIVGFSESVITELAHDRSGVRLCMVQLPGLNTPQFTWVLNRMARPAKPVPPVYQPEVAARAVASLVRRPRRNTWVGVPTAYTILGNRIAPKLADWYLGRTGFDAQQADRPVPVRPANLFAPADDKVDAGAHGPYSEHARAHDLVGWLGRHRRPVLAGALGAVAAAACLTAVRRR
ncbi:SDR family oxidoreductase [Allostreptomyces psammosilenae]|uniref:NAD(P)-dependent dehydrogenase (Short-subunit alcohol dehydrogenase family) n=1 Tax=Allostreptomyces psammosilenae TaxID=1892865 RepID=A0A853A1Q9_9ACTN|nr:SDR family oxidoreductase [Allostreptomyces psammosilenae]NYI04358.1 NAD(P)-dependent dehydrogenase (short-subunit alcohol dehydrogenase family) [Allostreptomyces psammosilenae]